MKLILLQNPATSVTRSIINGSNVNSIRKAGDASQNYNMVINANNDYPVELKSKSEAEVNYLMEVMFQFLNEGAVSSIATTAVTLVADDAAAETTKASAAANSLIGTFDYGKLYKVVQGTIYKLTESAGSVTNGKTFATTDKFYHFVTSGTSLTTKELAKTQTANSYYKTAAEEAETEAWNAFLATLQDGDLVYREGQSKVYSWDLENTQFVDESSNANDIVIYNASTSATKVFIHYKSGEVYANALVTIANITATDFAYSALTDEIKETILIAANDNKKVLEFGANKFYTIEDETAKTLVPQSVSFDSMYSYNNKIYYHNGSTYIESDILSDKGFTAGSGAEGYDADVLYLKLQNQW